ncbi:MAG TPA: hypothetical protein VF514_09050 [Bacteroidota bacterium]
MLSLILLATLSVNDPPPTNTPNPQFDTSHTHGITEVHQESAAARPVQQMFERGLFLNQGTIIDRILSDQEDAAKNVAAIDSLLRVYPELRGLVLRTLLMPKSLPGFFASSPPSVSEAWRLAGNSKMTAFEKSGLIKARQMELHDTWTEGRILAPTMDMIGTVHWLLELFK